MRNLGFDHHKLAPHLPVNQCVTFLLLSQQLYRSSEQRTRLLCSLGSLATQPLATWGLATLAFSHPHFCHCALPWTYFFHSIPLTGPVLFHENGSLINSDCTLIDLLICDSLHVSARRTRSLLSTITLLRTILWEPSSTWLKRKENITIH